MPKSTKNLVPKDNEPFSENVSTTIYFSKIKLSQYVLNKHSKHIDEVSIESNFKIKAATKLYNPKLKSQIKAELLEINYTEQ